MYILRTLSQNLLNKIYVISNMYYFAQTVHHTETFNNSNYVEKSNFFQWTAGYKNNTIV